MASFCLAPYNYAATIAETGRSIYNKPQRKDVHTTSKSGCLAIFKTFGHNSSVVAPMHFELLQNKTHKAEGRQAWTKMLLCS